MKTNKLKMLLAGLGIFILLVGGAFYYASTKLRPDEIKKLAIEQTQKIFPKSQVSLESVDIGWGINFNVNLVKFSVKAIKDNETIPMMSVDHLVLKVPVWAVLTGAGIIEVKLESPEVNYKEFAEGNNWTFALGEKGSDASKKEEDKKVEDKEHTANLGFVGKSKINIKLSDIAVKYALRDNSNGEIKVSRFVVKGLNLESSTAFEIASSAKFVMHDQSTLAFDTLVIGEFNISDLVKNGSASSVVIVKLSNMNKSGLDWKFPEVTTKLDVLLKKEGELSGNLTTSFESQNKISAHFNVGKQIELSDINGEIILKDIAAIMGLDKSIDMSKAKLTTKGRVLYGSDKRIDAQMNFAISPGILYSKEGVTASTTVAGDFKGNEISVKAKTEAMEGQVISTVVGQYNPNEKFDMTKLRPFDIRIVANGMKIPEKFIRSKLWDKKTDETLAKAETESSKKPDGEKEVKPFGLPPSSVILDWNNVLVGSEEFSGHGKIVTASSTVAIDNMTFKFSKGSGKLTQTMTIGKNASDSKFNFEIASLNISAFKAFLPPFIENFTGTFTGKVSGSATMFKTAKMPQYDVTVVADAKKGEIKKLNISDYVNPMLANIPVVKDQVKDKQIKIDGNFETLNLKGRFTNSLYSLNSFDFVGLDKKVQVTGSGEIYPQGGAKLSMIEVNFTDNTGKISDVLQKNTGSKILPMRVSGTGYEMKPEYGYTISKLAKGAFKAKGEEKIKEVVEKNLDKVIPAAAKEKVKGLLNGLFKK